MVRRTATLGLLAAGLLASLGSPAPDDPSILPPPEQACQVLIDRSCGLYAECSVETWCEAAALLAQQDRDGTRCLDALADPLRFPDCAEFLDADGIDPEYQTWGSSCGVLLDRVCGEDLGAGRPCQAEAACLNAELLGQTTPADEDGGLSSGERLDEMCRAALAERALYPRCSP